MQVKKKLCEAGKKLNKECVQFNSYNEDLIQYSNYNYVLVLDGSTGLGNKCVPDDGRYSTMAQWFVSRFAKLIDENIDSIIPTEDLIKECIRTIRKEYDAMVTIDSSLSLEEQRLLQPSASIALIRKIDNEIEVFSLGDLTILIKTCDGEIREFGKCNVEALDELVVSVLREEHQKQNIHIDEIMKQEKIQSLLLANRRLKNSNKPEGYWILGLDEEAVNYADIKRYNDAVCSQKDKDSRVEFIDSMIVCSDGFADYYKKYKLADGIDSFWNEVEQKSLLKMYQKLRKVEEIDEHCDQYPRFKKSDDATIALVHFKNKIRLYDKEEKKTKTNVLLHRGIGRLQSVYMYMGITKSAVVTITTAIAVMIYNILNMTVDDASSDNYGIINILSFVGIVMSSLFTIVSIYMQYRRNAKGTKIISRTDLKTSFQENLCPSEIEERDGFKIEKFYNGYSHEYYMDSELFNDILCEGSRIQFIHIKRKYELPDDVKQLVPVIMEGAFRNSSLIFNGKLLRQASHINSNDKRVILQPAKYFTGQCSHEIVYKDFILPGDIGVSFTGQHLLSNEENKILDMDYSPSANFLGASTIVLTKDMRLIIGKQADYSKANKGRFAPSGSGSVDYTDIKKACKYYNKKEDKLSFNEVLQYAMEREFCEECNYQLNSSKKKMSTLIIGYARLLERGGKPDYFGISYLDEEISVLQNDIRKSEYGLVGRMLTIHVKTYDDIPDKLEEFCNHYIPERRISIQLYLLTKYLRQMKQEKKLDQAIKVLKSEVDNSVKEGL